MAQSSSIYPSLVVNNNPNPNRILAFPLLGIIIKLILLIPVLIVNYAYAIAYVFFIFCIPFGILFSGRYWDTAYNFIVGYLKFTTKISLYVFGLTDKYPGFDLTDNGIFTLKIIKPAAPSLLLGFPILGFIIRLILIIPYSIFAMIINYGALVAIAISWFTVLFKKKIPESLYEFERDYMRIYLAQSTYNSYLSDKYPSFQMETKNKTVKILLIIAGILLLLIQLSDSFSQSDPINNEQIEYSQSL
jgi:hypothetical protein